MDAQHFQLLEHFTVILYDKASNLESVNEAQRELFCQKNNTMEHIHTNSGFPAGAFKVSGLPGWDLDNMRTGPAADTQSRRMWVDFEQRQPVLASCVEHTTDGL